MIGIQKNYKIIELETSNRYQVVPRESFIKEQIKRFAIYLNHLKGTSIALYYGESLSTVATEIEMSDDAVFIDTLILDPRHVLAEKMLDFDIFYDDLTSIMPNMKNGHIRVPENDHIINRGLIIRNRGKLDLIGAISFKIDLNTRENTILGLEIAKEKQGQKLGSLLLHVAIVVGLLYGSHVVSVESADRAIGFYFEHGFVFKPKSWLETFKYIDDVEEVLNYDELPILVLNPKYQIPYQKFLRKNYQISNGFDLRICEMIETIREQAECSNFTQHPYLTEMYKALRGQPKCRGHFFKSPKIQLKTTCKHI